MRSFSPQCIGLDVPRVQFSTSHQHLTRATLCPGKQSAVKRAMATTTSESSLSVAGTAASSSMPIQLNREPSQQELEVARQLIEHSQSIPSQQSQEALRANAYAQDGSSYEGESSNGLSPQEHHDLGDSVQEYSQPYPSMQTMTPTQRRSPASGLVPGGQMCRYFESSQMQGESVTDSQQQLRNYENPALETLTHGCGHLQRVRALLQGQKSNATSWSEARCRRARPATRRAAARQRHITVLFLYSRRRDVCVRRPKHQRDVSWRWSL